MQPFTVPLAFLAAAIAIPFPSSLEGRFRDAQYLGRGYSGVAFSAFDSERGEEVAVKLFLAKKGDKSPDPVLVGPDNAEQNQGILEEATTECRGTEGLSARQNEDPVGFSRLAFCLEAHVDADPAFIVMTLGGDATLKEWLRDGRPARGAAPGGGRAARAIFRQLQEGVRYMAEFAPPYFHNDLHLGNVVYTAGSSASAGKEGDNYNPEILVKIIDWATVTILKPREWPQCPDAHAILWDFCQLLCPSKASVTEHGDSSTYWFYWWKDVVLSATKPSDVLAAFSATDSTGPSGEAVPSCSTCVKDTGCPDDAVSLGDAKIIFNAAHGLPPPDIKQSNDGSNEPDSNQPNDVSSGTNAFTQWILPLLGTLIIVALVIAAAIWNKRRQERSSSFLDPESDQRNSIELPTKASGPL